MNILDLSDVIPPGMPVYPGSDPPVFRTDFTIEKDGFLEMKIVLYGHTGTHEEGAGWVPYVWPKPRQDETSPKISYVKAVKRGGKDFVAGCGLYDITPENIKKIFPGDPIYED